MVHQKPTNLSTKHSNYQEYLMLKTTVEVLQRSQRNLLGEDLGPLSTKELAQLELQLEASLNCFRSTKTQFMRDQLNDLQQIEQMLLDVNKGLSKKLEESSSAQVPVLLAWEIPGAGGQEQQQNNNNIAYHRSPAQSEEIFQPVGGNSNLENGYNPSAVVEDANVPAEHGQNVNGFIISSWML